MHGQAAQEWWNKYRCGKLSSVQPLVYFSRAKQLTDFKGKHARSGETHEAALLRTAMEIIGRRKIKVIYRPG